MYDLLSIETIEIMCNSYYTIMTKINIGKKIYDKNCKITYVWDNWKVNKYYCGKSVWHLDTLFKKFIMIPFLQAEITKRLAGEIYMLYEIEHPNIVRCVVSSNQKRGFVLRWPLIYIQSWFTGYSVPSFMMASCAWCLSSSVSIWESFWRQDHRDSKIQT